MKYQTDFSLLPLVCN